MSAMLSCLVVTCWENVGLLTLLLVNDFFLCFVTFPCGVLGQMWYLIVSIPDLSLLTLTFFAYTGTLRKYSNINLSTTKHNIQN